MGRDQSAAAVGSSRCGSTATWPPALYVVMETVIERRLTARVPARSADPRRHSPVPVRMRRKLRCEPDLTRTAMLTCGANSHAPP